MWQALPLSRGLTVEVHHSTNACSQHPIRAPLRLTSACVGARWRHTLRNTSNWIPTRHALSSVR